MSRQTFQAPGMPLAARGRPEAVERLVGAVLLGQLEDGAVTHRYMPMATLQALFQPEDTDTLPALAAE